MIEVNNIEVFNFEGTIRGMRNPMNSWDKLDSAWCLDGGCYDTPFDCDECTYKEYCGDGETVYVLGKNDLKLAQTLAKSGADDAKFLRQITVCMDINAPWYWWKEMDQYKVGTTTNSCSTMHKLTHKPFEIEDFSTDHMNDIAKSTFSHYVDYIEGMRQIYIDGIDGIIEPKDKDIWYSMIQMLPSSYNQKRTWTANYQVLRNIYHARKNHKLEEWRTFTKLIEGLPYAQELICI